jgi:hypothetical protein
MQPHRLRQKTVVLLAEFYRLFYFLFFIFRKKSNFFPVGGVAPGLTNCTRPFCPTSLAVERVQHVLTSRMLPGSGILSNVQLAYKLKCFLVTVSLSAVLYYGNARHAISRHLTSGDPGSGLTCQCDLHG